MVQVQSAAPRSLAGCSSLELRLSHLRVGLRGCLGRVETGVEAQLQPAVGFDEAEGRVKSSDLSETLAFLVRRAWNVYRSEARLLPVDRFEMA